MLMTNRPEWIAAVFGISLAGGVAVTLSTFSTPAELDYLLRRLGRFGAAVRAQRAEEGLRRHPDRAGAGDRRAEPGALQSAKYPFLRRLAMIGEAAPGHRSAGTTSWPAAATSRASWSRRRPRRCSRATPAVLFFSSGSTSKPKGILSAHRGVCIQMWRFRRMYGFGPEDHVRCWIGQRLLLVGQFRHGARRDARRRRCARAAADVRRRRGARADGRPSG